MQKTQKNRALIALIFAFILCLLTAYLFNVQSARTASANQAEDNIKNTIETMDVSIKDGASVSLVSPHVISWQVKLSPDENLELMEYNQALLGPKATEISNSIWRLKNNHYKLEYRLLLFDADKLFNLPSSLAGVKYSVADIDVESLTEDHPQISYGGKYFSPIYNIKLNPKHCDENGYLRVSIDTGTDNKTIEFVPILLIRNIAHVEGFFNYNEYLGTWYRLVYNPNAVRSVAYVSNQHLQSDAYLEEKEYIESGEASEEEILEFESSDAVLKENVSGGQPLQTLKTSSVIENLKESSPLDFKIMPGATLDGKSITWACTFNILNFSTWKQTISNISVWWIVLPYADYLNTGNISEDFKYNINAAIRIYPEQNYYVNEDKYVSECSYTPSDEDTYYIAIPYIKAVGIQPSVVDALSLPYKDVSSGTYILTENIDNARSINTLKGISEETVYTYNFEYLRPFDNKPFALRETKTKNLASRLDFNDMEMKDFANLLGLDVNSKGQILCLLSTVNHWYIEQTSETTYNIYAMYSIIPLVMKNDYGKSQTMYLGLISLANIDGSDEYAKSVVALKDSEGKHYFEPNEVSPEELFGYFFVYSYESEHENPNWDLDPNQYNGAISYFTQCTGSEYYRGYNEIGAYGAIGGAVTGAIIGTLICPGVGSLIGAAVGGVAGYVLSATVASLFGCEQDSKTVYYYVEYGFLDCTTMYPEIFYKLQKDPEMTLIEKVIFGVVILLELFAIMWAWNKFKRAPFWLQIVLFIIFVGLLVYADILLYQFFLTG